VTSASDIESIFRDAFEDVALLISGAASLHRLEDRVVRTLIRRLEGVRSRALGRLARADGCCTPAPVAHAPQPLHPVIERFLRRDHSGRASEGGAE
jgi:hypothetical protein